MLRTKRLLEISKRLIKESQAYEQSPAKAAWSILFLGDSTARGTGSDIPAHSVAGRFGKMYPNATIVNRGLNGQKIHQLVTELDVEREIHPDLLIIQIGANDILRFTPFPSIKKDLELLLKKAFELSDKVVILHSGRVGDAPFFPKLLGWIWNKKAAQVRKLYITETARTGATYVDLWNADLPRSAYADDLIHPNEEGYKIWFEKILKTIQ